MPDYPWPASALSRRHMAILHAARESSPTRVPITRLIAEAVEKAYAHPPQPSPTSPPKDSP